MESNLHNFLSGFCWYPFTEVSRANIRRVMLPIHVCGFGHLHVETAAALYCLAEKVISQPEKYMVDQQQQQLSDECAAVVTQVSLAGRLFEFQCLIYTCNWLGSVVHLSARYL